jgi:hypothetical protein
MNNIDMFKQMLTMQDDLNIVVNPDWKLLKYAWYRAVWIECAELVEHHGYKWLKKQEPDWSRITLEIVDIWHFGMSMLLSLDISLNEIAENLAFHYDTVIQDEMYEHNSFIEKVEVLAGTVITGVFDTISFFNVMLTANIDLDMLFTMYVGKNVLNKFRQANGYKQGTYIKTWYDGREDNEHLIDIMSSDSLKLVDSNDLISYIYGTLQVIYHTPELTVSEEYIVHSNGC